MDDATKVALEALSKRSRLYDPMIACDIVAALFKAGLLRPDSPGVYKTEAEARLVEAVMNGSTGEAVGAWRETQLAIEAVRAERAAAVEDAERMAKAARPKPRWMPYVTGSDSWGAGHSGRAILGPLTEQQARAVSAALNALEAGGGK